MSNNGEGAGGASFSEGMAAIKDLGFSKSGSPSNQPNQSSFQTKN